MRGDDLGKLSAVAQVQWGLVTARQAVAEGVQRWDLSRLVADGALENVGYGVYRIAGAPIVSHLQLRVAWLQLAPGVVAEDRGVQDGVVSHTSAAMLYGAGDFEPERFEFTCPRRKRARRPDIVVHTKDIEEADVDWLDQIPITKPARLIGDLMADRHDGEHVGRVLLDLLGARLATRSEMSASAQPFAELYGLPGASGEKLTTYLMHLVGWLGDQSPRVA